MNISKLFSILDKQESNLKDLMNIVNNKKEALVSNNYELLNQVVAEEEKKLLTVQLTEEERLTVMQQLFKEYEIDNDRYKLKHLIDGLKGSAEPQTIKSISEYETKIKASVSEISRINQLNMILIQQSKSLINQTIQAIVNTGKRSILDRKG